MNKRLNNIENFMKKIGIYKQKEFVEVYLL